MLFQRIALDEVGQTEVTDRLGRKQTATIINESGLYAVILRSDKPEAKPFRKWVTAEVLPAIRKRGTYIAPGASSKTLEDLTAAVQLLTERLDAMMAQRESTPFIALLDPAEEHRNTRHELPPNSNPNLQYRIFSEVDRAWSNREFDRMLACALEYKREDYFTVLLLGRYAGLRVRECFRIDAAAAKRAASEKVLIVKGEDGLLRSVPLTSRLIERLRYHLLLTPWGSKLFVASGKSINGAIKGFENFIWVFQHHAQDPDSARPMTFHGLRHTYAAEQYRQLIQSGKSPYEARLAVSKLLGDGRDDVMKIYLASLKEDDKSRQQLPEVAHD